MVGVATMGAAVDEIEEAFVLPASFAQERLWFLSRLHPDSAAYNLASAYRVRGVLDLGLLRRCFAAVASRHEVLRSALALHDSEVVQVVAPSVPLRLPEVDLAVPSGGAREAELDRLLAGKAREPLALAQSPLLRLLVVRLSEVEAALVVVLHHAIADGGSEEILIGEVAALYAGKPAALPALDIQYGDYAAWQRERLQGETLADLLGYWQDALANAPTVLDLPLDRPRPPVFRHRGDVVTFELPDHLSAAIAQRTEELGATRFSLLTAAFALLLARLSGQHDLVLGTPVAHRDRRELEPLIGLFADLVALRIDLGDDPSFRSLVTRTKAVALGALEHAELRLERLLGALDLARDPSRPPLFQAVFAYQSGGPRAVPGDAVGLTIEPIPLLGGSAKFEVQLTIGDLGRRVAGNCEYAVDLFDRATVERWVERFGRLLDSALAEPDRRGSDLPWLRLEERREILAQGLALSSFDTSCPLSEAFDRVAERSPDAVAASAEGGVHLTYRELRRRSDRLAESLASRGTRIEERVGLLLDRTVEIAIGVLGILKAGAAYVPIDPAYPSERIGYQLEDAGVRTVVGVRTFAQLLEGVRRTRNEAAATIWLDDSDPDASVRSRWAMPAGDSRRTAYVIYTSGSTGRPKGVAVTHANVSRLFSAAGRIEIGARDVWTLFHSIAFDFSVWELWGALLFGGRLEVVGHWVSRSPDRFLDLLVRERVTVLNQTPSAFRSLVQAVAGAEEADLALRYVIFGGESLEVATLAPWWDRFGDRRPSLVNMYGITETTVHVTYRPLDRRDLGARAASPIGRTLSDLEGYVVDGWLELVPPGVPGELLVGGAGLARGYLDRSALTAERFVPHPWSRRPGERLYRSGDRVRLRLDGELEYLGRIDQQVKIRGFRIETGEIEAALERHPQVREALVIAREEEAGEHRLVAYLVTRGETAPRREDLRAYLSRTLPAYMVPATFVEIAAIPLTPHGKADRRALPAPAADSTAPAASYSAPRNSLERALAEAWSEALGVEKVGRDDNFFALGGDSIRCLRTISAARARNVRVDVQELFRFPTVAELTAHLEARQARSIDPGFDAEEPERRENIAPFRLVSPADRDRLPADLEDAYPLARLQAGMLFHRAETSDTPLYQNVNSYRFRLRLDETAIARSIAQAVERHPVLRTSFALTGYSEPLQWVHRSARLPLAICDLSALAGPLREAALAAFWAAAQRDLLPIEKPPQLRFHLHRLDDESFQFTLIENHAILDGWSLHTVYREVLETYFALLEGAEPPLRPPIANRFRDFIAGECAALASPEAAKHFAGRLDGASGVRFPRRPVLSGEPSRARFRRLEATIPLAATAELRRLALAWSLPLKSLFLAVHARVVARYAGGRDVLTLHSANGRGVSDDADLACGLFLNALPLRLRIPPGSWRDLARAVYEEEVAAIPHRLYPVAAMQERFGGEGLFETAFVYLNFHVLKDAAQARRLDVISTGPMIEATNFTLATTFQHRFGDDSVVGLSLDCGDPDIGGAELRGLLEAYLATIESLAKGPEVRLAARSLDSPEERHRLIHEWNGSMPPPGGESILGRIVDRIRRWPDRIALTAGDRCLSYGEVGRRAKALARALAAVGLVPEGRVGLLSERSSELVVAVVGILVAGGVYVPLDPDLPDGRLRAIAGHAELAALLASPSALGRAHSLGSGAVVMPLAAPAAEVGGRPAESDSLPAFVDLDLDRLAYLLFTSGSTGEPKGVLVAHRGLVNTLDWRASVSLADARDRVLARTPIGFDPSLWELLGPLAVGAHLELTGTREQADPAAIARVIADRGITTVQMTPSFLRSYLDEPSSSSARSLAHMICGGETLPVELGRRAIEQLGVDLFDLYGPTEVSIEASGERHRAGDAPLPPGSVGRPIDNARVYVLGPELEMLSAGVVGELCIGGVGVARGYLGSLADTAVAFAPDPYADRPGARLYRTGDLAQYGFDGRLILAGRSDDQVKIRGVRVELGEIVRALEACPAVSRAAVAVRGRDRLVAWVVPRGEAPGLESELRSYLHRHLPSAMVPARVLSLAAFPLTANGKLDVAALPDPEPLGRRGEPAPPRDAIESDLIALWENLFGIAGIGIRDDFFDLGGNSLLAVRMTASLRSRFLRDVPLALLLEAGTIEGIARLLRSSIGLGGRDLVVPLRGEGGRPPFFCVAPGHGSVLCYLPLARNSGTERPFLGLQWPALTEDGDPYRSVEEMAARYVEAIRLRHPTGPYLVGGWSFGGLVAFEIGRQLAALDILPDCVVLFDTRTPDVDARMFGMDTDLLRAFLLVEHAKELAGGGAGTGISPRDLVGLPFEQQMNRLRSVLDLDRRLPADLRPEMIQRYLEVRVARMVAIRNYRLEAYPGRVVLLRSEQVYADASLPEISEILAEGAKDPTYGWSRYCRRPIELRWVPGHHESIVVEPNVRVVGEVLEACLAESDGAGRLEN
jgi:amino acid adenylation domain-containing protein